MSYTWANNLGEYVLSPGKGVGFYTPLSLDLTNISIVVCPSAFWHGPQGIVPDLLLSAGILYRGTWLTGGISARYEFDFTENSGQRLLAGAEIHLFPPPSILVFSINGGIIQQGSKIGGYGGLTIGMIY